MKSILIILGAALATGALAQEPFNWSTNSVVGLSGQIEVSQNIDKETVAVIVTTGKSSTQAFLVQYDAARFPRVLQPWSGQGRVLVTRGALAVIGEDDSKYLFLFPKQRVPASLTSLMAGVRSVEVFGLAAHGQVEPLTRAEVESLKATGRRGK